MGNINAFCFGRERLGRRGQAAQGELALQRELNTLSCLDEGLGYENGAI